ncbi:MAG TPA: hypothetical protein VMW95_04775 [Desulfobacterales bacterium]|nr:hypothetical protein [Desulfobacterales bacterium]
MNVSEEAGKNFAKLLFQMRVIREGKAQIEDDNKIKIRKCNACKGAFDKETMKRTSWRAGANNYHLLCPECYERISKITHRQHYDVRIK